MLFFILITLRCLEQEELVKFFFLDFYKYLKKMVTNMKLAFCKCTFRCNSTYFLQKWLRFKVWSSESD